MVIAIIILSVLLIVCLFAIRNLLLKVEKYEDVTVDQVKYLQNISNIIADANEKLKAVDSKGIFEADDEVGFFFQALKSIQEELDVYMLPENYGEKEIEE
jgi:hypothetical protein